MRDASAQDLAYLVTWLINRADKERGHLSMSPPSANELTMTGVALEGMILRGEVPVSMVPLLRRYAAALVTVGEVQWAQGAALLVKLGALVGQMKGDAVGSSNAAKPAHPERSD